MHRSALPSTDPSVVWLANLIGATEVVAASVEPCHPTIVKAFSHRLQMRGDVRASFEQAGSENGHGPRANDSDSLAAGEHFSDHVAVTAKPYLRGRG
jgi:hypothetical protein